MSGISIKWQRVAVERAATGADASAMFHETRSDDQARVARQYADSLEAAALTLKAIEMGESLDQRPSTQRRRAS